MAQGWHADLIVRGAGQAGLARMGLPCSEDYLREMMNQYDEDHDGTVDFQEFQHYVQHRRRNMRAAFEEMDFHHTGTIDEDDLVSALLGTAYGPA